jgi:hypothetical protein
MREEKAGGRRELYNEDLHNKCMHSSLIVIKVVKSRIK